MAWAQLRSRLLSLPPRVWELGVFEALSAVAVALEVKVEMQDAALKGGLEALLVAVLPLLVQDLERCVLVWRPRMKDQ